MEQVGGAGNERILNDSVRGFVCILSAFRGLVQSLTHFLHLLVPEGEHSPGDSDLLSRCEQLPQIGHHACRSQLLRLVLLSPAVVRLDPSTRWQVSVIPLGYLYFLTIEKQMSVVARLPFSCALPRGDFMGSG